jgi:single-stranded-DNA-specific exonuclease
LIETYYKPNFSLYKSGDKYAASARSVKGFDVYNALSLLWISRAIWWPHVHAAGMTLAPENYAALKQLLKCRFEIPFIPICDSEIEIDAEINFSDITPKFFRILKQFEPFGPQEHDTVFL